MIDGLMGCLHADQAHGNMTTTGALKPKQGIDARIGIAKRLLWEKKKTQGIIVQAGDSPAMY